MNATSGSEGTAPPLVVACVGIADRRPEVDPLTASVRRDRWGVGLSAPDAAAVEHALRIGEAWGGRVAVVTAAGADADPMLRELLALGAEVVRLDVGGDDPSRLGSDERWLAESVVAALATLGRPSVVVCGDRSPDRGTGALPGFLAHRLGSAQALGLVGLAAGERHLVAERRLDGGWRERLRVPCPAVVSVEAAGVRLRRAPLPGTLAVGDATVPVVASGRTRPGLELAVGAPAPFRPRTRVLPGPRDPDPRRRLAALTGVLATHEPPTVVGPVDPPEAVDALLAFLGRHGYLDGTAVAGDGRP
jgi:electron transfer flavoprotein beta subunit